MQAEQMSCLGKHQGSLAGNEPLSAWEATASVDDNTTRGRA